MLFMKIRTSIVINYLVKSGYTGLRLRFWMLYFETGESFKLVIQQGGMHENIVCAP
jgi:hypothetical protein